MALKKELENKVTLLEKQLSYIRSDISNLIISAADDYSDCDIAKEYIVRLAQIVGCEVPTRQIRITLDIDVPINIDCHEMEINSITINGEDYPCPYHYDSEEL